MGPELFYLTLTLMLGTLFERRSAVLGIAFGVLLGLQILASFIPQIAMITPLSAQDMAILLAMGQPLPGDALLPLAATALWCLLFTGIALWKFQREEF